MVTNMRNVFTLLGFLMLIFMSLQLNDPDAVVWMFIYGVTAVWCLVAAYRSRFFKYREVILVLLFSNALAGIGVVYFWPISSQFWQRSVWWNVETAREGMGMMVVMGIMISILIHALRYYKKTRVVKNALTRPEVPYLSR